MRSMVCRFSVSRPRLSPQRCFSLTLGLIGQPEARTEAFLRPKVKNRLEALLHDVTAPVPCTGKKRATTAWR